ncbi:hypothetical protein AAFF_G00380370 [Aldrovandia affinis]|uniref:Uncharacterized protein n=1 Tax=Aldrovandia affinis TaxID=143900 RepID=A0AAD7T7Z7_9TELE|nr:hypothetical protein AAFF_G00380370 [Aldrovandia affinis]
MQGDVYLLQKVHLRDEEDAAVFAWEWVWSPSGWGSRLEVCLSTMRSLILGGEFNVCFDRRDGVGKGGIDYSARALAEVVKDFSLVDTFRALHPSDAGFTWRNTRGAVSRLGNSCFFWECPFAGVFWGLVLGLLRRVGPRFVLSGDGVVFRRGLRVVPTVSAGLIWDVLGYAPSGYCEKTGCRQWAGG